jgi:hypothetical protein
MMRCKKCNALIGLDCGEMFGGETTTRKVRGHTFHYYKKERMENSTTHDPYLCLKCYNKKVKTQ